MADEIDWARLRARIAETPVVVKPKYIKHPNRSQESLEKRRIGARIRNKNRYWANREECLASNRAWEKANPEKVKAKKKRFYDSHKNDPIWMENHRLKNRETKIRRKFKDYVIKWSAYLIFMGSEPLALDENILVA